MTASSGFDRLWADLEPVGRDPRTGGYRRFAWTREDHVLREWFAQEASARGLDVTADRAGNQWAWWGDPDARSGVVVGSHLDSVPDGGAFDGPLGVISAFAAVDELRAAGFVPSRPVGVVNFGDEEGARFGVACAGSRLLTGALTAPRALGLRDGDGVTMAEAMKRAQVCIDEIGEDQITLRRIGVFVELHIEQGRGLADLGHPVGVGSSIWPHGRWRFELAGEANHAGTTRLADRRDPMLDLAAAIVRARELAVRHDVLATCGKVQVEPNGVNAIPSKVTGWLDARGADPAAVRALVADLGIPLSEETWTPATRFDAGLVSRLAGMLGGAPVLATGAGHDAGILANAGVPAAMLFVRNPSGVSHSPAEHASRADCQHGVQALARVLRELALNP
ncbi:MAG TPA: allantoate amidohydrolase [Streptosporangiaceae bacterium]|jgi:N-carbamoyl-L-amino-acid hydrolase|nr:allantoate amidohydrolase [Streptosporangiaceae bacterium]